MKKGFLGLIVVGSEKLDKSSIDSFCESLIIKHSELILQAMKLDNYNIFKMELGLQEALNMPYNYPIVEKIDDIIIEKIIGPSQYLKIFFVIMINETLSSYMPLYLFLNSYKQSLEDLIDNWVYIRSFIDYREEE